MRIIVIGKTGGEDRRLAPERRRFGVHDRQGFLGARGEGLAVELGQFHIARHARDLFQKRPGQPVVTVRSPVRDRRREARELSIAVRLGQLLFIKRRTTVFFALGRAVAQHQVREIDIEFMRRHVGAFGQEAHVAQGAGVHDLAQIRGLDAMHFGVARFVHHVEQAWEGIAKIEAAAAAMTDVELAPHLGFEFIGVEIIGILPVDDMACRRFETAFSHASGLRISYSNGISESKTKTPARAARSAGVIVTIRGG